MMEEDKINILEIRGAYKRYSSTSIILRGLDMTVAKGSIYGLLGPSGCGKTTLLSCVAGTLVLDDGSIQVNVSDKSELGFMPQDIALQELFTVSEMFMYFGRVFGLPSETITKKAHELLHLMELPEAVFWNRLIGQMSGGQQRRISLAVTLLHDPVLMVLDEPTVGLDPLLGEKLWQYFLDITEKHNKTIIITTHYIEETRRAHKIGLMRSGVLLTEAPPLTLLSQYNCDALEDVFLILSQKQNVVCVENENVYPKRKSVDIPFDGEPMWNCNRMRAEIYRNFFSARRNIPMLMFMLVLPAVMVFIFCTMCSENLNSVVISTVSEEVLPDSCLHPILPTQDLPICEIQSRLSCRYLQYIEDKNYIVEEHEDFKSAYQSVESGRAHAMIHFERNYTSALLMRLSDLIDTSEPYVDSSIIKVHMDRSDLTTAFRIEEDLRASIRKLALSASADCGYNPKVYEQIMKIEAPIFGELREKFTKSAFPGFIIPFVFYVTTYLAASTLSSDKASGFLGRSLIAGVQQTEVMFAQTLVQAVMIVGQNVLVLTLAYGVFEMPLKGSWWLAIALLAIAELQGMFYGFLLATAIKSEKDVTNASTGTVMCIFLSCGLLWPIEGAHWIIRYFISYFPVMMTVQSYRNVTVRGWGITHSYIVMSIITNIGLILLIILMFVLVSKVKK